MTAYQFCQPWASMMNDPNQAPNALEWAHLRQYLQGIDTGAIPLFNPTFQNFTAQGGTMSGVLIIPLGSAGSPSITFTGNTNTGIYSSGTNALDISINGTDSFTFGTTGLAMNSLKITGLANGTASSDGGTFGQISNLAGPINILDNGGFEIWQRGTSFTNPANNAYTADRWVTNLVATPTSWTVSQDTSTVDTGSYSLKVVVTTIGSASIIQLSQLIENYLAYANKTLTLSCRVWSNVGGVALQSYDGHTTSTSATHPGDSAWHTLTLTFTVSSTPTKLAVYVGMASSPSTGTFYVDSAILTVGSEAVNFLPLAPQQDLARCQRYFQIYTNYLGIGQAYSTTQLRTVTPFPVVMRTAPTVTVVGGNGFSVILANGTGATTSSVTGSATIEQLSTTATMGSAVLTGGNAVAIYGSGTLTNYVTVSADL